MAAHLNIAQLEDNISDYIRTSNNMHDIRYYSERQLCTSSCVSLLCRCSRML